MLQYFTRIGVCKTSVEITKKESSRASNYYRLTSLLSLRNDVVFYFIAHFGLYGTTISLHVVALSIAIVAVLDADLIII